MIIFIADGKYCYRYEEHEIFVEKSKTLISLKILNKLQNKLYSLEITEEELNSNIYFQNIKKQYNVLELFGLSDVELFTIIVDNCIKKKIYKIKWFKMNILNITSNDSIKFEMNISPNIDLHFKLDMVGYI